MLTIRALAIAALLGVTPALAEACDNHCKVRIHVCRSDDKSNCKYQDLLPDETVGLCAMMMTGVAYEWIIERRRKAHENWTLESAECVQPDDNRI